MDGDRKDSRMITFFFLSFFAFGLAATATAAIVDGLYVVAEVSGVFTITWAWITMSIWNSDWRLPERLSVHILEDDEENSSYSNTSAYVEINKKMRTDADMEGLTAVTTLLIRACIWAFCKFTMDTFKWCKERHTSTNGVLYDVWARIVAF